MHRPSLRLPLLLLSVTVVVRAAAGVARAQDSSPPAGASESQGASGATPQHEPPQPPAAPQPSAPPQPSSPPEPPPPPSAPEEKPKEDTWIDVGHAFIEQRIFAPVLRLDRFFSDERPLEAERSRSFLRWRSQISFQEHTSGPRFTTGIRANLRLPGLEKRLERLRVIIEGQTRDTIAALFPTQPGTSTTPLVEEPIGTANAELRLRIWETLVSHADVGAGVLFQLPPGVYGQTRLRFVVPIKKLFLTRYVASGFWRTDTHFGTYGAADIERPLGPTMVALLGGNGTLTQRSHGVEWNAELALRAAFDIHSGAQIGATVNGATRALPSLDRWRVYTRLRRDFYRRWLFFELEPAVAWLVIPGDGRHPAWQISWLLEVQFQGNERPVSPPTDRHDFWGPMPAHEPQDPPSTALPPALPPR